MNVSITVLDYPKVQNWKQFTTTKILVFLIVYCFRLPKSTKLKAIHNRTWSVDIHSTTVLDYPKVQNWKQFTTPPCGTVDATYCFRLPKSTKLKAIHNYSGLYSGFLFTVLDYPKVQNWKQFTTRIVSVICRPNCFRLPKSTKLKAIHNRSEQD